MAEVKFKKGDKVLYTRRAPAWVQKDHRGRARTIVDVMYSQKERCTFYELGLRGKSKIGHLFRSYELKKVRSPNKRGKPPW